MDNSKTLRIKTRNDLISRIGIFVFSTLGVVALIAMFGFIIAKAMPAYSKYGFFHMYFSADFSSKGGYGIWGPLLVTLITSIISVIIATPIALRAAFFIRYRMKNYKKPVTIFINILAGVPSVVFGIFALKTLSTISRGITGATSGTTIFNATLMLIIMVFPTLVSLILNQLNTQNPAQMNSSIALGNTRTHAMYSVVRKSIKQGIYVAVIVALGRAIGETMALSIILTGGPASNPFSGGFLSFLNSPLPSLGVQIATNMFTDKAGSTSALFAAGVALFVIVMLLTAFVTSLSKRRTISNINPVTEMNMKLDRSNFPNSLIYWSYRIFYYIGLPFKIARYLIVLGWSKISTGWSYLTFLMLWPFYKLVLPKKDHTKPNYEFYVEVSKHSSARIWDKFRIFLETVSIGIIIGMTLWIFIDVLSIGLPEWTANDWKYAYVQNGKAFPGSILNPLIWTLVLIGLALVITFPFALCTALFLSEYARNSKMGKTIRFFIDSLNGTPSILFGLFGLIFFLNTLHLNTRTGATSLIAGTLTIMLVILPTFTRSIEQVLVAIPNTLRNASYALGASKIRTIVRVILPQALPGIITGVVLSAGRIIAETAPLYLTLGMFVSGPIGFFNPGHTLTTEILNIYIKNSDNLSLNQQIATSYKLASAALLLVGFVIGIAELVPKVSKIISRYYQDFKNKLAIKREAKSE